MTDTPQNENQNYTVQIGLRFPQHRSRPERSDELATDTKTPNSYVFQRIGHEFETLMQMLWKYMHTVEEAAQGTSLTNLLSVPVLLEELLVRQGEANEADTLLATLQLSVTGDAEPPATPAEIPVYERSHLDKIIEFQKYHNAALRILHETIVQQIVNAYENVLANILRWRLLSHPESAPKDKSLSYSRLLEFSSLQDAHNAIVEDEVEAFLKNKSTEEQLTYLRTELRADLSSSFPYIGQFKEFILCRHSIVHAGGRVTKEYLRRAKALEGLRTGEVVHGERLSLDLSYVRDGWSNTFAASALIIHLVAVECSRKRSSSDEENKADEFVSNAAYGCIRNRQYDAAERVLRYMHKRRLSSQAVQLRVTVNLAQTLRWKGQQEECEAILGAHEWEAHNSTFQMCVAALRGRVDEFRKHLKDASEQKAITMEEMYEWPVFTLMRKEEDFSAWLEQSFGKTRYRSTELFDPQLLDLNQEARVKRMMEHWKERASELEGSRSRTSSETPAN